MYSVGSSGQTIRENITVPLKCADGSNTSFKHAFLLSEVCPINLMGRDLMCKLGLCLISTSEGVKVHRLSNLELISSHSFVHYNTNLSYAYQWKLQQSKISSELVSAAQRKAVTAATDMTPEDLHCTSHVSPEPDESYEEGWLKEGVDKLSIRDIYWTTHRCAVSLSLTPAQFDMYTLDYSAPHITLAKHTSDNWEDLGPFVQSCQLATDWQETSDRSILFSVPVSCCRPKGGKKQPDKRLPLFTPGRQPQILEGLSSSINMEFSLCSGSLLHTDRLGVFNSIQFSSVLFI